MTHAITAGQPTQPRLSNPFIPGAPLGGPATLSRALAGPSAAPHPGTWHAAAIQIQGAIPDAKPPLRLPAETPYVRPKSPSPKNQDPKTHSPVSVRSSLASPTDRSEV